MTSSLAPERWSDVPDHRRARGINQKWIGCDDPLTGAEGEVWDIGGCNEGAQGAFISGPVKGLVHVPFKGVWHEPAYGPPRFERLVDEQRQIHTFVTLVSDNEYGWMDTETRWWNGMRADRPGFWSLFTRRFGELYVPVQLIDAIPDELEEDPTNNGNCMQQWEILLGTDGDPRWRTPDVRPPPWTAKFNSPTVQVKRDDGRNAPKITARVGKFKVANRGTEPAWPIYHVTAPGRCWLPDGMSGRMIRVPQLFEGEHVLIDTDPAHRIAISAKDPVDNWMLNIISNAELLNWLGVSNVLGTSKTETILERFHGQGFTTPIAPRSVATLPVFHTTVGAKISVHLPQRYERAIS